jgi:hypothetical protein
VLVLGLDSGDWRYLQPLIDGGYVPALADFQAAAAWGPLDCVPAAPNFACFCPIVWTSTVTGQPRAQHGIASIAQRPSERLVPAIWNVLRRHRPVESDVALASFRNTWPPETDTTWNVTEPGALILAEERFFDLCPAGDVNAEATWPGSTSMPETWTQPPGLLDTLGLVAPAGAVPPSLSTKGSDRTSQRALVALLGTLPEAPRLTMTILHHIDKTKHVACTYVTDGPFGPVNAAALQAEAENYTGPVHACPTGWGNTANAYLEADEQVAALLATQTWDYVVVTSDHGMTAYPPGQTLPCQHGLSPAVTSGSFGVRGPGVRPGPVGLQDVLCVAPLLAYLLDVPVARALPCVASGAFATMLGELFDAAHLEARPPIYVDTW